MPAVKCQRETQSQLRDWQRRFLQTPIRFNSTARTATVEESSPITRYRIVESKSEEAFASGRSASMYSRIKWIMPMTCSVCCKAAVNAF